MYGDLGMNRKYIVVICFVMAIVLVCIIAFFTIFTRQGGFPFSIDLSCNARDTTTPDAPIFPTSILVNMQKSLDTPNAAIYSFQYKANDSPQNITAYYRKFAVCDASVKFDTITCHGKSSPFGKYAVYIDYKSQATTMYLIEVAWDRCSPTWSKSIE
jgi:hypothetical protein